MGKVKFDTINSELLKLGQTKKVMLHSSGTSQTANGKYRAMLVLEEATVDSLSDSDIVDTVGDGVWPKTLSPGIVYYGAITEVTISSGTVILFM